jgi:hypothetical protein
VFARTRQLWHLPTPSPHFGQGNLTFPSSTRFLPHVVQLSTLGIFSLLLDYVIKWNRIHKTAGMKAASLNICNSDSEKISYDLKLITGFVLPLFEK